MRDALRSCLQIAEGLSEAARKRAVAVAQELAARAENNIYVVQRTVSVRIPAEMRVRVDDILRAGRKVASAAGAAGRDRLESLLQDEAERAADRFEILADELGRVCSQVDTLEQRVRDLEKERAEAAPDTGRPSEVARAVAPPVQRVKVEEEPEPAKPAPAARRTPAKNTAAKKAAPKKAVAKRAVAKKAAASAKKTVVKTAAANRTAGGTAKKTAKKAAKKTGARKVADE